MFEKLHKFSFLKKKPKRSPKIERSQIKFLVAKQCRKKSNSRNLALLTPSWPYLKHTRKPGEGVPTYIIVIYYNIFILIP